MNSSAVYIAEVAIGVAGAIGAAMMLDAQLKAMRSRDALDEDRQLKRGMAIANTGMFLGMAVDLSADVLLPPRSHRFFLYYIAAYALYGVAVYGPLFVRVHRTRAERQWPVWPSKIPSWMPTVEDPDSNARRDRGAS